MKHFLFIFLCGFLMSHSQTLSVGSNSSIYINSNSSLSVDGPTAITLMKQLIAIKQRRRWLQLLVGILQKIQETPVIYKAVIIVVFLILFPLDIHIMKVTGEKVKLLYFGVQVWTKLIQTQFGFELSIIIALTSVGDLQI